MVVSQIKGGDNNEYEVETVSGEANPVSKDNELNNAQSRRLSGDIFSDIFKAIFFLASNILVFYFLGPIFSIGFSGLGLLFLKSKTSKFEKKLKVASFDDKDNQKKMTEIPDKNNLPLISKGKTEISLASLKNSKTI